MKSISRTLLTSIAVLSMSCGGALAQSTVELWSFLDPDADNLRSNELQWVIEGFEQANPGVTVDTTVVQWSELSQQLLRATRAGNVPDVVMLFNPDLQSHISAGTLLSLEPYLDASGHRDDLILLPDGIDSDGNVMALPWELRVGGLMVRTDLLDAAGYEVPQTLPELAQMASELGTDGLLGFGLGFKPTDPAAATSWFFPTVSAMGASILNEDGSANFTSPEMVQLSEYVRDLVSSGAMSLDAALMGDADVQQLAEGGRTVFIAKATHRLLTIRERSGLGDAIQMMAPPTFDPDVPAQAIVGGWALVIPQNSENPDAAWTFIDHFTSPEVQLSGAQNAGYLPVRTSLVNSEVIQLPENSHIAWALEYAAANPYTFNVPENRDFLNTTLSRAIERIVAGQAEVEEALSAAEVEYNRGRL